MSDNYSNRFQDPVAVVIGKDCTITAESGSGDVFSIPGSAFREALELYRKAERSDAEGYASCMIAAEGFADAAARDLAASFGRNSLLLMFDEEATGETPVERYRKELADFIIRRAESEGWTIFLMEYVESLKKTCSYCREDSDTHIDRKSDSFSCSGCGASMSLDEHKIRLLLTVGIEAFFSMMVDGESPQIPLVRARRGRQGRENAWSRKLRDIVAVAPGDEDYIIWMDEGADRPYVPDIEVMETVKEIESAGEGEEKERCRTKLRSMDHLLASDLIAGHKSPSLLVMEKTEEGGTELEKARNEFMEALRTKALDAGWYVLVFRSPEKSVICPGCGTINYFMEDDESSMSKCLNCGIVWDTDELMIRNMWNLGDLFVASLPGRPAGHLLEVDMGISIEKGEEI